MNEFRPIDDASEPVPHSLLEDMMADDLHENDIVLIDEVAYKFLTKIPHGPHVFWCGDQQKQVPFSTAELFKLQAEKRYYRPGRGTPSFGVDAKQMEYGERVRAVFPAFKQKPRSRATTQWMYVQEFINRIVQAKSEGNEFARNSDNAALVMAAVAAKIQLHNDTAPPSECIEPLRNVSERSVLRWVAREFDLRLQEAGLLHGNSITPRPTRIPRKVYEIIAEQIRDMVELSYKFGPTKIWTKTKDAIRDHNLEFGTELPPPSLPTVHNEYRRYSAWIRLAKQHGVDKADLEYGAVGKLERPARILDLVEVDHHLFDLHPVVGTLGETTLGLDLAKSGLDRFWVCLAYDVHSGYPLGFTLTFEPGGLIPALMCIDHAVRPKTYVRERWPEIQGDLLGFGKPVKLRYDNAKEFVSWQLQANLQRIGVGFELAKPKKPDSKPYVERFFGTLERDFVHWLKGSTGANTRELGDRKPTEEAAVGLDDFMMLLHQYLIEVYCRRPQDGLDGETPEARWMRGATSPRHRPRPLTDFELSRWDVVTTLQLDLKATDEGIRWRNLFFQSDDLQELRKHSGQFGLRSKGPTPVKVRIPLLDVSKAYVVLDVDAVPGIKPIFNSEIVAIATNPHVKGRTVWQHEAVCDVMKAEKKDPTSIRDYEEGFLRLFRNALVAMGAQLGETKGKVRLTGGQAPRFIGAYLDGPAAASTSRAREVIERYDILREHLGAAIEANPLPQRADVLEETDEDHDGVIDMANDPIDDAPFANDEEDVE